MGQVIEHHIKNSHICTIFYNIQCVRNQVAFRQLTYVGKILLRDKSNISMILLTEWCDNPRKWGGQLMTNKDSVIRNLRLIITGINGAGSVSIWGFHALDLTHWFLLLATLKQPTNTM